MKFSQNNELRSDTNHSQHPSSLVAWLFDQQLKGVSLGLEAPAALLGALGDPQKKRAVLHIAGTNGKGSVSAFLGSILKAAGLRVGLYTSPHLVDFRERIQVNGELISAEDLDAGIRCLQSVTEGWGSAPTFFELTTALAFDYFDRQECDVIVLETGVGGRLDATNLASNKIACAITPISMDHQEWLGSTLADIAREKAGIMRPGVPVVTSPQPAEAMEVLKNEAARVSAPLIIIDEPLAPGIPLGLLGSYQRWNAALALKLIEQGPWNISEEAKQQGLKGVSWPGRFQRFRLEAGGFQNRKEHSEHDTAFLSAASANSELPTANSNCSTFSPKGVEPLLILDGAHNPAAAQQLVATWKEVFPGKKCHLIFGSLLDKKGEEMLRLLEPITASIILVPVNSPRSASPLECQKKIPSATTFSSLREVFEKKNIFVDQSSSFSEDLSIPFLLTGSLFLVGEALAILNRRSYSSSWQ